MKQEISVQKEKTPFSASLKKQKSFAEVHAILKKGAFPDFLY